LNGNQMKVIHTNGWSDMGKT